jgi:hypothetical protein
MTILFVGIDLAKNVFALHGVNSAGTSDLVRPEAGDRNRSAAVVGPTSAGLTRAA